MRKLFKLCKNKIKKTFKQIGMSLFSIVFAVFSLVPNQGLAVYAAKKEMGLADRDLVSEQRSGIDDFSFDIQWGDTDENTKTLEVKSNTSNAVRYRVSYSNPKVCEEGYDEGELIITVKGMGGIYRSGKKEATVGADKASETNKQRDWSYTWNADTDVYTFTNNKRIEGNAVLSGYFDIVYDINARESIHNYTQSDIQAELLLPDGTTKTSRTLTFKNKTTRDVYESDITTKTMYSFAGLTQDIEDPSQYAFIRYDLQSALDKKARGFNGNARFVFNPDDEGIGEGAVVISPFLGCEAIGDGTYKVNLRVYDKQTGIWPGEQYLFVAYPLSSYGGKTPKASLTTKGQFYEEDSVVDVAKDIINVSIPVDFSFPREPGNVYAFEKYSSYELSMTSEEIAARGGHMAGYKLDKGTTESFTIISALNNAAGTPTDIEITDDFLYITQNNGDYRALDEKDYDFQSVTIPGTSSLKNENGLTLTPDKYTVNLYAVQDGKTVSKTKENLVKTVKLQSGSQVIALPEGTTAWTVEFEDIDCTIDQFSLTTKVNFHLDEDRYSEEEQANLISGQAVNTSFIKLYQNGNWINEGAEANYDDLTNLNLAQKDKNTYGDYLIRDKGTLLLYEGEKSNYTAPVSVAEIERKNSNTYTTTATLGAQFNFKEEEIPDQFSLYTILPDKVSLNGYDIEEDTWNVFNLSGFGLDSETLVKHTTVEINEDYEGSGLTRLAFHFDFSDMSESIPQNGRIDVKMKLKINKRFFQTEKSTLTIRSALIMDKEINEYARYKVEDDGSWYSDKELASDIDGDDYTEEHVDAGYGYSSYIYADSSQFQITKSVQTDKKDGYVSLPDVPKVTYGNTYSYELSVKNGSAELSDIEIVDALEQGENAEWQGTFKSIDVQAESLTPTIWYSEKTNPDALGSSSWKKDLDKSKVKSIALDFGDQKLKAGEEIIIEITMQAPNSRHRNEITENLFTTNLSMVNSNTGEKTPLDPMVSNAVQVQVTATLKNLVVTKVDEVTKEPLEGAEFALYEKGAKDAPAVATATSNADGQIIFKDIPSDVDYLLREIKAPQGYELATEDVTISFDEKETYRMFLDNVRKKGTVQIVKNNNLDPSVMVQNAEYAIYNADGEEVQTAKTDINGVAEFTDLPWGEYTVQEKTAPKGYERNDAVYNVTINRQNVDQTQIWNTNNVQGHTKAIIHKYEMKLDGSQTQTPVQGAAFKITRTTNGQNNTVGTYVTDKDGNISISDLAYGTYKVQETRIPAGFEKVDDFTFSLTPENPTIEQAVYDKHKAGSINLYKKDNLGNAIEDVTFELYDETKTNVLGTYTTEKTGSVQIENLEWSTYYLKEKSAPDCYEINQDWFEVVIGKDNLNVDVTIENQTKKGSVLLTKTDEVGMTKLEGAEFALYKADGTLVQEGLTTDENGELTVDNLEWGSYYFKETKAPDGYGLTDETIRFSVNALTAGVRQEIQVEDPLSAKTITITKRLKADDINFYNGNPTFLFKVEGQDVNGKDHTYYRMLKFDETYVKANTDEDGYVSQNVLVSGLTAGKYTVTEEEASRYQSDNTEGITVDLTNSENESVTFTNNRYENGGYSDTESVANVLKEQAKLTAISVKWKGESEVKARDEIDKSLIEVTAIYDDGSTKELSETDWSFGDSFSGSSFPNINGNYRIPVEYTEGGLTKTDGFDVTIYGMVKEIVRLDAGVKEEYKTVVPGMELSADMFDVTAVYNTGETESLNSSNRQIITSPNWPNNYPANMKEEDNTWTKTLQGASKIKVVFDDTSKLESTSYDWVYVKDGNGNNVSGKLGGTTIAGQEVIVSGDTVTISMRSDGSNQYKGFSATLIPLDGEGNEISKDGVFIFSPEQAPEQEGMFDVNISLNPDQHEEKVTTKVTMNAQYPEPILADDSTVFHDALREIFGEEEDAGPEGLKFMVTDKKAPETVTTYDVSEEQNNSVVIWYSEEDNTVYMSSQQAGKKVIASENSCKHLFYYKQHSAIRLGGVNGINIFFSAIDITNLDIHNSTSLYVMFAGQNYCSLLNVSGLNAKNVTDMSYLFESLGEELESLTIKGLNVWDVSQVTNMSYMFYDAGQNATALDIGDLSQWNVSNVTTMSFMFNNAGQKATTFDIGDLSQWDTSQVTSMSNMFSSAGYNATTWNIGDLGQWDVSKVTSMSSMFSSAGYKATTFNIGDLSQWNVSKVTNMSSMFYNAGWNVTTWSIGDLSQWDVSNVISMQSMFAYAGYKATTFNIGDIGQWDVSQVTNMSNMFHEAGRNATRFDIGDLSQWNVSQVTSMRYMFAYSGKNTITWNVGDLSQWNVSNVKSMDNMFEYAGQKSSIFDIGDIGQWDVSNVTDISQFLSYAGNNATTWNIGDLSHWNVSKITDMSYMFAFTGCDVTIFDIGNLSQWDVSNVQNMSGMFRGTGSGTIVWNIGDLGQWDVSNVKNMNYMFDAAGNNATTWNIGDLSNWDVSQVTSMSEMLSTGQNATTWNIGDLSQWDVSKVTDMSSMFYFAGYHATNKPTTIDLSNWDLTNVTTLTNMFSSNFFSNVTTAYARNQADADKLNNGNTGLDIQFTVKP